MNMQGWDTISFLKIEFVNKKLKEVWHKDGYPFFYSIQDEDFEFSVDGVFSAPSITFGGSNKVLHMNLPVAQGFISVKHSTGHSEKYSLTGCECVVGVMLQMIPNVFGNELAFDFREYTKNPDEVISEIGGWIIPIVFTPNKSTVPKIFYQTVLDCVGNYLSDNPDFITEVLAAVSMQSEDSPWMSPKECTYSFLDSNPPRLCVLGLCDYFGTDISTLPVTVDIPVRGDNSASLLTVSGNNFLLNGFVPAMESLFPDISASRFKTTQDGIENDFPMSLKEISYNGRKYDPRARDVKLRLKGNTVFMYIKLDCDLDPFDAKLVMDINAKISVSIKNGLLKCEKPDITQTHKTEGDGGMKIPILDEIVKLLMHFFTKEISENIVSAISTEGFSVKINPVKWLNNNDYSITDAWLEDSLIIAYK